MSTAGMTLVEGPKYDLPKVLAAFEELLDALVTRFGATSVSTARPGAQKKFVWPDPGKRIARQVWERMHEMYDVVDEPLVHAIGGFTVKAFLLGKTWCVRNVVTGEITTPEGEHVSTLAPAPTVCIYGEAHEDGSYRLIDGATMDAILETLAGPLARLGLDVERSTLNVPRSASDGRTDYAFITFPHGVYGAGRGWLGVRCVNSDGSEYGNDHLN